jgi:hypothetical protein
MVSTLTWGTQPKYIIAGGPLLSNAVKQCLHSDLGECQIQHIKCRDTTYTQIGPNDIFLMFTTFGRLTILFLALYALKCGICPAPS